MQCLTFCRFDGYGVDGDQKIQVQIQDNCKTDCPACSRVCPEAAILFPKYKAGPINGDVVREEDLKPESMKVDISALPGGDIYAALRQRSTTPPDRFSPPRAQSHALMDPHPRRPTPHNRHRRPSPLTLPCHSPGPSAHTSTPTCPRLTM